MLFRSRDGSRLAILFMDFFPRASKRGGAWCGTYRDQTYEKGKKVIPIVTIVCNFTKPAAGEPALLSADETSTMFHEFGHALHQFFQDVHYAGVSNVPRDFVELPSQVNEHWAFAPEVLKVYAKHYKTGEAMPQQLPHAQVIIVGDSDQLPSVGPGQVLADLLKIPELPKVCLEKIFRQSEDSTIVTLEIGRAHV